MNETISQVKAALNALSNPQETQNANQWLVNFEKSNDAWQISLALLQEVANSPHRFFGAKFLYSKVQKQFVSLDQNSALQLAQALVQCLLSISREPQPDFNVIRYLCLSLSALTLQLNQNGVVSQILLWLNPIIERNPSTLLILLTILPEESVNHYMDVSSEIRDSFISQLSSSSSDVANFLSSLWPRVGKADRVKILKCTENWLDIVHMSPNILFNLPLYQSVLTTLADKETTEDLFDKVVDLTLVIIRRSYPQHMDKIITQIFPIILGPLRNRWSEFVSRCRSQGGGDAAEDLDDDLNYEGITLCRLFTETAEATLDIYTEWTKNLGQSEMLHQLLDCTSFGNHNIGRIPLKFFYELSMSIRAYSSEENKGYESNQEYTTYDNSRSSTNGTFSHNTDVKFQLPCDPTVFQHIQPIYQSLLQVAVVRCTLPRSKAQSNSSGSLSDEFSELRVDWRETILDCAEVLSSQQCFQCLCVLIENQTRSSVNGVNQPDVLVIESILFAMQIIAPSIATNEVTAVPQLLSFITTLPTGIPILNNTSIDLLGRLANWLNSNPSYLEPVIVKLSNNLSNHLTSKQAANATMLILSTCRAIPDTILLTVMKQVSSLRATRALELESDVRMIEGLMASASYLPLDQSIVLFRSCIIEMGESLGKIITQLEENRELYDRFSQFLLADLERITIVFRSYKSDHEIVCQVFIQILPMIQRLLQLIPSNESLCEKVCRCYKFSVRCCGQHFLPYLPKMTEHLAVQFATEPFSAFLYAASICVSTFSLMERRNNAQTVSTLYKMLWSMSETFFSRCKSVEEMQRKPDLVEEYFFLMAKYLQYIPAPFVESREQACVILNVGLNGLSIQHREAQKGMLLFFERFIQLSTFWAQDDNLSASARQLILSFGEVLCRSLFRLLQGLLPAYAIDESNGSITDVLWIMKKRFEADFKVWASNAFSEIPLELQSILSKYHLLENLLLAKGQREFGHLLDKFEMVCRRNV